MCFAKNIQGREILSEIGMLSGKRKLVFSGKIISEIARKKKFCYGNTILSELGSQGKIILSDNVRELKCCHCKEFCHRKSRGNDKIVKIVRGNDKIVREIE